MTTAVSGPMATVSTGTSGIGISSTIARFSDRAIIPSTVRITGLPGWQDSTRALMPSMLASESGSGLTCETTHDAMEGKPAPPEAARSGYAGKSSSGSVSDSGVWGSAVIVGWVRGHRARAERT